MATLRLILAALRERDHCAREAGAAEGLSDGEIASDAPGHGGAAAQRDPAVRGVRPGRPGAEQEAEEIAVIEQFLPPRMSEGEIASRSTRRSDRWVPPRLKETGKVIAALKERYNGQMDFAVRQAAASASACTEPAPAPACAGGDLSLEEFKARLPLVEIVGRYVKLTRRGREHLGLCPFHKEKTPSFNVVEDKGFYHCFGCGAHGTAIDFVMAIEGLGFPEALERLADLTGIPAPRARSAATAEPSQRLLCGQQPRRPPGSGPSSPGRRHGGAGLSGAARRLGREIVRRLRPGLRAGRAGRRCERALLAPGLRRGRAAGGRRAGPGRGRRRRLRPLPPPDDVPDRRRARPASWASAAGRWARRGPSI